MAEQTKAQLTSRRWFYGALCLAVLLFIHFLGDVLTPFITAFLLAYLVDPFTSWLVKIKVPRTLAVVIVFVLLALLITGVLLIFIPLFERQVVVLVAKIPQFVQWLNETVIPWLSQYVDIKTTLNLSDLPNHLSSHWQQAGGVAKSLLQLLGASSMAFAGWVVNLFLIPVVLFYLLRDWPKLLAGAHALLPRAIEPVVTDLVLQCDEVLSAFLRGQLMVMIALGLLYSIGLALVGIDTALVIGMLAGLASIVPYLGFIVGILSASIAALFQFHDVWHLIGVVVVFIIAQSIEGSVLTPWLVGNRVRLHPIMVIFAVLAGGKLFGFVGVLLAIPVAAVLMVILRYLKLRYVRSHLYS